MLILLILLIFKLSHVSSIKQFHVFLMSGEHPGLMILRVLFIGRVLWIDIRLGSVDGSRAGDCHDWYPESRFLSSLFRVAESHMHVAALNLCALDKTHTCTTYNSSPP